MWRVLTVRVAMVLWLMRPLQFEASDCLSEWGPLGRLGERTVEGRTVSSAVMQLKLQFLHGAIFCLSYENVPFLINIQLRWSYHGQTTGARDGFEAAWQAHGHIFHCFPHFSHFLRDHPLLLSRTPDRNLRILPLPSNQFKIMGKEYDGFVQRISLVAEPTGKPETVKMPRAPQRHALEKLREELEEMLESSKVSTRSLTNRLHAVEKALGADPTDTTRKAVPRVVEDSGFSLKQNLTVQDFDVGYNATTDAVKVVIPRTKLISPEHLNVSPVSAP